MAVVDRPPATGSADRPLAVVAKELADDVRTLVTQEIDLAKAEVGRTVSKAAIAAGLFAAAGVLALYLVGFVFSTLAHTLEGPLPDWAAWLIVTGFILVLIVTLVLVGMRLLPKIDGDLAAKEELEATTKMLQDRVAAAQQAFQGDHRGE